MRRPVLIAMLLTLTAGGCAPVDSDPLVETRRPIIGGTPDTGMDLGLPIILIRGDFAGVGICSGSMITRRVVMTAAHCADGADDEIFEVWFTDAWNASDDVFTGGVDEIRRVAVEKWVHPMWAGSEHIDEGYDIALLLLDQPMPASDGRYAWPASASANTRRRAPTGSR